MAKNYYWRIRSRWQKRGENPSKIAARFHQMMNELRNSASLIQNWYYWETNEFCVGIRERPDLLISHIEEKVSRDEYGAAEPGFGYNLQINNTASRIADSQTLILSAALGSNASFNSLDIKTPYSIDPDPSLLQYSVYKDLVLAIVSAFEPDFICVYPTALPRNSTSRTKFYKRVPLISEGWMVYLAPSIAAEAKVPPSLIQQRCEDGGLFLATTDETFDLRNMEHRKQVFLMEGMLDPLNGVTWRGL